MIELIGTLVGAAVIGIILMAVISPLESMGWWAGWVGVEKTPETDEQMEELQKKAEEVDEIDHYVVFLTGIAGVDQEIYMPEEQEFLRRLGQSLEHAVIVDDIYPYSVTNRALTGQRAFAWFWRFALRRKSEGGMAGFLINVRNMFQVLVSADRRYGPMYNRGSAQMVLDGLIRHGYQPQSEATVDVIGYSGGGQIALGAARYLNERTGGPLHVISLGGVMAADPGVLYLDHLYHIRGELDKVQRIGQRIFPGRWPIMRNSFWNRALLRGKITFIEMGPIAHSGAGGYLDVDSQLDDGESFMDKTVATIAGLIEQDGPQ